VQPDAPGLVPLDRRGEPAGANEAGARLLAELPDDHVPVGQPIPLPVMAVATRTRRAGAGDDASAARAHARTRSGRWMVLHGTRLDRDIAVVIEPARPVEMAELIMLGHGLTTREREITRLVLQGAPPPRSPPPCAGRRTPCRTTSRPSSPRSGSAADNSWPPCSPDHDVPHLGRPVGRMATSRPRPDDPGARGRAASFRRGAGRPDRGAQPDCRGDGGRAPTRGGATPGWGRAVALTSRIQRDS
jgi:hypothetical protein